MFDLLQPNKKLKLVTYKYREDIRSYKFYHVSPTSDPFDSYIVFNKRISILGWSMYTRPYFKNFVKETNGRMFFQTYEIDLLIGVFANKG